MQYSERHKVHFAKGQSIFKISKRREALFSGYKATIMIVKLILISFNVRSRNNDFN